MGTRGYCACALDHQIPITNLKEKGNDSTSLPVSSVYVLLSRCLITISDGSSANTGRAATSTLSEGRIVESAAGRWFNETPSAVSTDTLGKLQSASPHSRIR